jgi:heat shock protein HslJ
MDGDNGLRERLSHLGTEEAQRRADLGRVTSLARRMRVRRYAGTLGGILLALAGVGVPLAVLVPLGGRDAPSEGAPTQSTPATKASATTTTESTSQPSEPPPSNREPFVPPTTGEGGLTVMPITLPDGSTAELAYPPELRLAELGVFPSTTACGRTLSATYGDAIGNFTDDSQPLREYEGANGQTVGLWRGKGADLYLVFRFGNWTVAVPDQSEYEMTEAERTECASLLRGEETPDGFLLLGAEPPLQIAPTGGPNGPQLFIGQDDRSIVIYPQRCSASETEVASRSGVAELCFSSESMFVQAYGPKEFLEDLLVGLDVRNAHARAFGDTIPPAPDDLWGRTFVSVTVTERGEPRRLVTDTRIEVAFEKREPAGVVRWDAGCNYFGSEVEITGDRLLVDESMEGTALLCPDELHDQDEWLGAFFSSDPKWQLTDKRLTLTSGETVIEFEQKHA